MDAEAVYRYFAGLQASIVAALEAADGTSFRKDEWQRPEGGGGISRIVEDGSLFERGGVNLSRVLGRELPPSASASRPQLAGRGYDAMGVSLVLHPRNPHCPTVHLNVRFFVASAPGSAPVWWFGGGMDLTPYYGFEEDARHFHACCRAALDAFDPSYYPRFKSWCDDYFRIRHRGEPRGVGGIFFDDFAERGFDHAFAVARAVGDRFVDAYLPIVERRHALPFGERELALRLEARAGLRGREALHRLPPAARLGLAVLSPLQGSSAARR